MRRWATLATVGFLVAACTAGEADVTTTAVPTATTPVDVVKALQATLEQGDFAAAGALAVPGQAALASLAEGATIGEVAAAVDEGSKSVGANFWSGFAQGSGQVLTGALEVEDAGTITEMGVDFHMVKVTPSSGEPRTIATRDLDRDRIDLFASFGAGLASRLRSPVELLLDSSTDESALVLSKLQDIVPSLMVATHDPALSPQAVQEILQLVELITRVS